MLQEFTNTIIKQYQIKKHLAHGGMAEIYLAEDLRTGKPVAIKMVHLGHEDYCERFRREIATIATLPHEHILPALDYGEYEEWCYMVMPYIEGGTLADHIARGPFTLEDAGEILAQLSDALQFAHDNGIVHRDIKPSNVLMYRPNYAYLADFGLVKDIDTDHSITQSGFLIGTPDYMAPELVDCPANAASDIYALGVLLYQMLAGKLPFHGTTPIATIWKHLQELPETPSKYNPALPTVIEKVVLKALEKNPQKRFQSVRAFQQAYQRALEKWQREPVAATIKAPVVAMQAIQLAKASNSLEMHFYQLQKPFIVSFVALMVFATSLFGFGVFQHHPVTAAHGAMTINLTTPVVNPEPTTTSKPPKTTSNNHPTKHSTARPMSAVKHTSTVPAITHNNSGDSEYGGNDHHRHGDNGNGSGG